MWQTFVSFSGKMLFVILLVYFPVGIFSLSCTTSASYSDPSTITLNRINENNDGESSSSTGTTNDMQQSLALKLRLEIYIQLEKAKNEHPNDMGYQAGLNIAKAILLPKIVDLEKDLNSEQIIRKIFQSLIDFRVIVLKFLDECYPKWAPRRKERECTDEMLRLTFLNVEHPKVNALIIDLHRAKLTVDDLIKIVIKGIIPVRHDVAHCMLTDEERVTAYAILMTTLPHAEKSIVQSFLNYCRPTAASTLNIQPEDEKLVQDIERNRQSLRLIRIPNLNYPFHDEAILREVCSEYAETAKLVNPIAFIVGDQTNGAYLLFDDFKNTLAFFLAFRTDRKLFSKFSPVELNPILIADIQKDALWGGICYLQIKVIQTNETSTDTLDKAVIEGKYPPRSLKMTNNNDTAVFQYDTFEETLKAYEYFKKEFESVSLLKSIYRST